MKFITLQDAPSRQFKDDNGATKVEFTNYSNITVPVNKSLGFAPMWAIPITTFKETLADLLLCAPNCPRFVCIFESNNYVRVDKLKHYRNIMDGLYDDVPEQSAVLPLASDDLPDYLTEYCLDIRKLPDPIFMGSTEAVDSILANDSNANAANVALDVTHSRISPDNEAGILLLLQTYLRRVPQFEMRIPDSAGFGNKQLYEKINAAWFKYRYTVLPLMLSIFCDDVSKPRQMDSIYLESCVHNIDNLMKASNDETSWSYSDCSLEKYLVIHQQVMDLIIDSKPVLERLFFKEPIGRNEKCPCGSGIKYKKCHGRYNS